jgi:hypothetical protein
VTHLSRGAIGLRAIGVRAESRGVVVRPWLY